MMQQIVFVVIAVGVVLGALFAFIDCLVALPRLSARKQNHLRQLPQASLRGLRGRVFNEQCLTKTIQWV